MSLVFSSDWGSYATSFRKLVGFVRYDRGIETAYSSGVASLYPHNLELTIYSEVTTLEGFPVNSDFERFNEIEDGFVNHGWDFYLVGIISGEGRRRFIFWLSDDAISNVSDIVGSLLGKHIHSIRHTVNLTLYDSFQFFLDNIEPNMSEHVQMITRKICEQMKDRGELFITPRTIDFYCTFFDSKRIASTVKKLKQLGYSEVSTSFNKTSGCRLHITKVLIPTVAQLTFATNEIISILEPIGAHFAYWYSPVYNF